MSEDMKLTSKIVVEVVDDVLKNFEILLTSVVKKMNLVDKAAKDMLSGIPQGDKVSKIVKKTAKEIDKEKESIKKNTHEQKKNTAAKKKGTAQAKRQSVALGTNAKSMGKITQQLAKIRVAAGLTAYGMGLLTATFAIPAGVIAGWTYFLNRVGNVERKLQTAAQAVGVSANFLSGLTLVAEDAGLSMENASDQLEELVNRVGDAMDDPRGKSGTMFDIIGLSAKQLTEDLETLGRETTYKNVIDAILSSDLTDAMKIRAGDELFGGEGNRMLAIFNKNFKETGQLATAQLDLFSKMVGKNEQATKAASSFSRQLGIVGKMAESLLTESLHPVFDTLVPVLERVTDYLTENRKAVVSLGQEFSGHLFDAVLYVTNLLLDMVIIVLRNKDLIIFAIKAMGAAFSFFIKPLFVILDLWSRLNTSVKIVSASMVILAAIGYKLGAAFIWINLPLAVTVGLIFIIANSMIHLAENSETATEGLKAIGDIFLWLSSVALLPFKLGLDLLLAVIGSLAAILMGDFSKAGKIWSDTFDKMGGRLDSITDKVKNAITFFRELAGIDTSGGGKDSNGMDAQDYLQLRAKRMREINIKALSMPSRASAGTAASVSSSVSTSTSTSTVGDTTINVDATNMNSGELQNALGIDIPGVH